MPEGDTIWRTAATLRPRLVGRRVVRAEPAGLASLAGRRVEDVHAEGKHLLIRFEGDLLLHSHMRMSGRWQVFAAGMPLPRSGRPIRALLEVEDGTVAVCFSAPVVELTSTRAWVSPTGHLGPDVLVKPLDIAGIVARGGLSEAAELGVLLLDQRVCAGIGNMWRCETLWELRLDPWTPVGALDRRTVVACYQRAHELMTASIRGARRAAAVHGRGRRPCLRCGRAIAVRAQGEHGRLTYWCPGCQTMRTLADPPEVSGGAAGADAGPPPDRR
jgi:endonuclease VIII